MTQPLPTTKVGQVPTTTPLETGLRVLLANRMGSKFLSSQDTRGSVVSHCQASLAPARNLFGKQEKYTIPHVYSIAAILVSFAACCKIVSIMLTTLLLEVVAGVLRF